MSPHPDDNLIEFPPGPISVYSVQQLVTLGINGGAVAWREGGSEPVFQLVESGAQSTEAEVRRREIEEPTE